MYFDVGGLAVERMVAGDLVTLVVIGLVWIDGLDRIGEFLS